MNVAYATDLLMTGKKGSAYSPPKNIKTKSLKELLGEIGRGRLEEKQLSFLEPNRDKADDIDFFYAGDLSVLDAPAVAVVGTRNVSSAGASRAARLARELAEAGVTIVSGLARGIDTYALRSAIDAGGRVAAVIGTPLQTAYPAENKRLQEEIYRDHLLISQFREGERVFRANFPKRNRLMATVTDGTAIVEAADGSGTLHQAAECQRLGRWLFLMNSLFENKEISWPTKFTNHPRTITVDSIEDILSKVR